MRKLFLILSGALLLVLAAPGHKQPAQAQISIGIGGGGVGVSVGGPRTRAPIFHAGKGYRYRGAYYPFYHNGGYWRYRHNGIYYNYQHNGNYWRYRHRGAYYNWRHKGRYYVYRERVCRKRASGKTSCWWRYYN